MAEPFLALITPLTAPATQPPGIWGPTDPRPTHPIAGYPWPIPGYPDQGLPGSQPRPDQGLPGNQPYPDQGLPGQPPRPWGPIFYPDQGLPGQQPRPGQGLPPFPSHPIVLPPELPETMPDPDNRPIEWKTAWSQTTGWIVIGIPQGPVPTPSA